MTAWCPIEATPETPRTSKHYRVKGFKGVHQLAPIVMRDPLVFSTANVQCFQSRLKPIGFGIDLVMAHLIWNYFWCRNYEYVVCDKMYICHKKHGDISSENR